MREHELYFPLRSKKSFVESALVKLNVDFSKEDENLITERLDHAYNFDMKAISYHFDEQFLLIRIEEIY